MSPLFQEGDYLVTRRRPPAPGDVIVFEHPHQPGFHLLKRVIGLAGQIVEITDGDVAVDGNAEDSVSFEEATRPDGHWKVPPGHLFVLGDARHRSRDDSRELGPIHTGPRANVVVYRYWPAGRMGRP
jgi:signal peptidase I